MGSVCKSMIKEEVGSNNVDNTPIRKPPSSIPLKSFIQEEETTNKSV